MTSEDAAGPAELLAQLRAGGLLEPGGPVVVLVSGGRDSVCLLDACVVLLGPSAVTAAHVNYGLRSDSGEDEALCAALCDRLGVEMRVDRPVRGEGGGNVQAWAREARYAFAAGLAEERDATIATGHTADDQVETILYRLASSPSRRALLGMRARDGRLVRPLLGLTRAGTTAYCEARGLAWRDDPSNEELSYARNRIRHELVPALGRVHPAAARNVLRTAEILRGEAAVLDELVAGELGGGAGSIGQSRLREIGPALRRLVVQELADRAAGRPVAGAAGHADEVAELTRGGSALDLGSGVRVVLEGGIVRAELASPVSEARR